jgi:ubiquitin-protein ligase
MSSFLINRFSPMSTAPADGTPTIGVRARRRLDVGGDFSSSSPSTSSPRSNVDGGDDKRRQATLRMCRQRTLKDYQIMLEFRHLKEHAPPGIYILPSLDNLRQWSGVIFIRKGLYKGGIFRFFLELPRSYPANGACPRVTFVTPLHHPHVDTKTGRVDILSHFDGKWIAGEHYIVVVLSVLKSMFFFQGSNNMSNIKMSVQNASLLKQWNDIKGNGRLDFMQSVRQCVSDSIEMSGGQDGQGEFENGDEPVLRFSKHQKQHQIMKQNLMQTGSIRGTPFVVSPQMLMAKRRGASVRQSEQPGKLVMKVETKAEVKD